MSDNPYQGDAGEPASDLEQWVRNALAHLYDDAYLQNSPLMAFLSRARRQDAVTRAQALRRTLLECVEDLAPRRHGESDVTLHRVSAVLAARYLDGLSNDETARQLSLSPRQTYREHNVGIKAVASLLKEKLARNEKRTDAGAPDPSPTPSRLALAKAEVDRLQQEVNTEGTDLAEVLNGVIKIVTPLAAQRAVEILADLAHVQRPVLADRLLLRQALLLLLTEAINTTEHGQVRVDATADERGLAVEVRCVAHAALPARPAPAVQAPRPVEVSVATRIMEAQGGQLLLQEGPEGWLAILTLGGPADITVLVVDDNADLLALVKRYLAAYNVSVVGSNSANLLRDVELQAQPQVILLDLMMPTRDGWDVLQELKSRDDTRDIPVIICSVLDQRQLAASMGASGYLTKPITQADLLDVLRRQLKPPQILAPRQRAAP